MAESRDSLNVESKNEKEREVSEGFCVFSLGTWADSIATD